MTLTSVIVRFDRLFARLAAVGRMPDALLSPTSLTRQLGYGWSDAYFGEVARRCDQIAVMGSDSSLYLPRAYAWLMAEQVERVCPAVRQANPNCRVLIGVPTYKVGGMSHHAHAENLSNALRGIREGFQRLSLADRGVFAGIAPFADYTTDAGGWENYSKIWLGSSQ